jgi:glycosyltransferase involved in cell wall biosynthesis
LRALIFSKVTEGHGAGGMQRHLSWLVDWLAQDKWQVTVATTEGGEFDFGHSVRIQTIPNTKPGAYTREWWKGTQELIRRTRPTEYDAIISEDGGAWAVISEIRYEVDRPPVVMFRHGTTILNLAQNLLPRTPRNLWSAFASLRDYFRFARRLSGDVDIMVAISRRIADSIEREGGVKASVRVVPIGVDLVRFAPSSDPIVAREALGVNARMSTLVWVGRDVPGKRVEIATGVFEALQKAGSPFQLIVVTDRARLTTRSAINKLRDRWGNSICLIEGASVNQMHGVYAAADLELFPSILPEGVPLVILEALASGIPVLCADTHALRQVPPLREESEWFVHPSSIEHWVRRIVQLTAEPTLTDAKKRARRLAELHCDQRITREGSMRAIHDAVHMRCRTAE